ncbi:MAG TPA: hypothetical protein VKT18_05390, partial [Acidimicrobiales bacterium]|nr:hypothetical protein [Acidimicrobiales bacterium]
MTTLRVVHCEVAPVSIAPGSRARSAGRTVAWSAAVFAASFLACCWIAPAGLGGNGGLSDFGGHLTTFVPYWVGLWTLALGLWRAAGSQPDPVERVLLRLVGVLVAAVVFMFSALGPLLAAAHVVVGAAAFTLSLVVS